MTVKPEKLGVVAFAAVAALLGIAGCGGKSSGATGTGTLPIASQSAANGAGVGASATPSAHGSAASGITATGGGSTAAGTTGGASAAPQASTKAATAKAPGTPTGFTRPGTYTYTVSGTAKQPIGGTQQISGTDTDTFDPPQGSTQHNKETSQRGSSEMTLQVRSSGLYVADIHIAQQGFDEDFRPVGTAKYFPASYPTGTHWTWQAKSTDGKYTLDVASKISGTTHVAVGGKSLKAVIVDSTLHITGSGFDISVQQRDWVSTTYALVLKEHSTSNGTAFGASFSSDVSRQIRSTTPS